MSNYRAESMHASRLVYLVTDVLNTQTVYDDPLDYARSVIYEVARWLDAEAHQRQLQPHNGVYAAAEWLRGELEKSSQK